MCAQGIELTTLHLTDLSSCLQPCLFPSSSELSLMLVQARKLMRCQLTGKGHSACLHWAVDDSRSCSAAQLTRQLHYLWCLCLLETMTMLLEG